MAGDDEERIALFLDYENLAIGAREALGASPLDFRPIADALAERGRVVVRRAYADWSRFDEDRRMLTRHHVELIEIPQRMGVVRKNAADIKMAVDAIELCVRARLHHDVRARHRRQRLHAARAQAPRAEPPGDRHRHRGLDVGAAAARVRRVPLLRAPRRRRADRAEAHEPRRPRAEAGAGRTPTSRPKPQPTRTARRSRCGRRKPTSASLVTQTLSGLERSTGGPVLASMLKRTILRKDPTFNEATYGFRGFGELLRHLAERGVVELGEGTNTGDPEVTLPDAGRRAGRRVRAAALGRRQARGEVGRRTCRA